jgi:ubiquitin-like modifier-activating enzyme 5
MSSAEELKRKVAELEEELKALKAQKQQQTKREKVGQLSDVVVDSNPYSRLMALKKMGIVANYEVKDTHKDTNKLTTNE